MKILECSSIGDKRFSAFYAHVEFNGIIDTIENHYQSVKFKQNGVHCKKGEPVHHIVLFNQELSPKLLTPFYRYLWYKYLRNNPELVAYARQFDDFNDKFRGKSINCQADCIRAFINKDNSFYKCIHQIINLEKNKKTKLNFIKKEFNNMKNSNLTHISNGLDQLMVDMLVNCMTNPDNKDFYIGNFTLGKLKTYFAEMPSGDVSVDDIFWTAFGIAQAKYLKEQIEIAQENNYTGVINDYTSTCPECGCRDYIPGVACPNCDYVEEV